VTHTSTPASDQDSPPTSNKAPVLLIALDAADHRRLEQKIADGDLPRLAALRDEGGYGLVNGPADWLVGAPWPTFYTSSKPADHGLAHYLMWMPDRMRSERPTHDELTLDPFWRHIGRQGRRVLALDPAMCLPPRTEADAFHGVESGGWTTTEMLGPPYCYPAGFRSRLAGYGPPPRRDEKYGLMSEDEWLDVRDECMHGLERMTHLATDLITSEPWDLSLVMLDQVHRAGHRLHDFSGLQREPTKSRRQELASSLDEVYVAADHAVGKIVDAARAKDPRTQVLVFALHGMGVNTSKLELLDRMLERVLAGGPPEGHDREDGPNGDHPSRAGLLKRMRARVPLSWRQKIKHSLPLSLQDRLTAFWRMGSIDWDTTKAFTMLAASQGYIRINLKGREAKGVVEPGEAYERLCEEIAEGLKTFVDEATGRPIVHRVAHLSQVYPSGANREPLPDLFVQWSDQPTKDCAAAVSPTYGRVRFERPGKHPTGRSGNHTSVGFVLASCEAVEPGEDLGRIDVKDLAPAAYEMVGLSAPASMQGASFLSRSAAAKRSATAPLGAES